MSEDETAFYEWADKNQYYLGFKAPWMAALRWERSKKAESLGAIGARQAIERINESDHTN